MTYVELAVFSSIAPVLKKALVILNHLAGGVNREDGRMSRDASRFTFPQQVGEQADVNIAYRPNAWLPGQVIWSSSIKNDA